MESLRILRDSLDSSRPPPAGPTKRYDKKLNSDFKAAALHLTNLYRNSIASSQSTYRSGYLQGLRDILDLLLLRTLKGQSPSMQQQQQQQQQQQHDFPSAPGRAGGTTSAAESSMISSSVEEGDYDDASWGASQKELRWLTRYLRARIEAIKSESDDEDAEGQDGDQHQQQPHQSSSSSSRGEQLSYQSSSTPAPISSRTRESSLRSQRLSNEPAERAPTVTSNAAYYPSSASTSASGAPDNSITHLQRPFAGGRTALQDLASPVSSQPLGQGQQRDSTPALPTSSEFSFSMTAGSSTATASATARSSQSLPQSSINGTPRRRVRGMPALHTSYASSPVLEIRQFDSDNYSLNPASLSPVGEESTRRSPARLVMGNDMEDVREERPNGRRGALMGGGAAAGAGATPAGLMLDGQGRPKRRRKTTAEKVAAAAAMGIAPHPSPSGMNTIGTVTSTTTSPTNAPGRGGGGGGGGGSPSIIRAQGHDSGVAMAMAMNHFQTASQEEENTQLGEEL